MMRKTGVLALCVLLLGGCARRVENPGPPQITILEDAVIEVNQPDFSEDVLRAYFKAVDSQGNELPAENVVFLNNANNSLLGTSYIKIKAVDKNGYYDVKTLKVTTVDHTAPTYVLPVQPPVFLTGEAPELTAKTAGILLQDNFNRESTLVKNFRWLISDVDYTAPGTYSLPGRFQDSSGNAVEFTLSVKVSEDPVEKAQACLELILELCQGSANYFILDAAGEDQQVEIHNYDAILDAFFTAEGRRLLEASTFAQRVIITDDTVSWIGAQTPAGDGQYIKTSFTLAKQDKDQLTFDATSAWQVQGQRVEETSEFILKKEQGVWKIDSFVNPLDGPPANPKTTPSPSPQAAISPLPSASPQPTPSASPKIGEILISKSAQNQRDSDPEAGKPLPC